MNGTMLTPCPSLEHRSREIPSREIPSREIENVTSRRELDETTSKGRRAKMRGLVRLAHAPNEGDDDGNAPLHPPRPSAKNARINNSRRRLRLFFFNERLVNERALPEN